MPREQYKFCEEAAASLLEKHNITKPFVDVFYIAEKEGLSIRFVTMPEQYKNVAGFIDPESKAIFVNKEDPVNRRTFTVAHELGHYILKHDPKEYSVLLRLPVSGDQKTDMERQADVFAANLLVPKEMLIKVINEYNLTSDHASILARIFGVSRETMIYRLKFLGLDR